MSQPQRLVLAPHQIAGDRITLTAEQQHYLVRVLRLRQGDRFIALDGRGGSWLAAVSAAAEAQLLQPVAASTELAVPLTLLVALPKTGMEDIVRQATELGATTIVPVSSSRTLLQPSAAKVDRWQRIAQEAAEQSERLVVPQLVPPQPWTEALAHSPDSARYLCAARGDRPHLLTCLTTSVAAVTLATGPEGGWTDGEMAQAIAAGYQPVSLGSRVLRAVTAPIVALALVASVFEAMPQSGENE